MTRPIETTAEHRHHGGTLGYYRHASAACGCEMNFSVFVPPQAAAGRVPVVTFLSGLTCTEENFMVKSGAQRVAAELGIMLVSPDTSPRGEGVPDDVSTQSALLDRLETWGFRVSPERRICVGVDAVIEAHECLHILVVVGFVLFGWPLYHPPVLLTEEGAEQGPEALEALPA